MQVQSTLQNFFLNVKEDLYLLQIDAKKVFSLETTDSCSSQCI